jgi:septum formation protein
MSRAIRAAVHLSRGFNTVADDAAPTVRARGRKLVDGAFETVECVVLAASAHLERLVVVVTADFASAHDIPPARFRAANEVPRHEDIAVPRLVLASASPRRAELLRAAGIEFDIEPAHVDETPEPREPADTYVRRIAEAKAQTILARRAEGIVVAADTTVVIDEVMLGKPADEDDARRMLGMLSGRRHDVLTGVSIGRSGGRLLTEVERTVVEFAPLTAFEIDWYVATGEPRDKAGAYAIQGYASRFVTRIDGSYSNVVGLPVALVYEILKGMITL